MSDLTAPLDDTLILEDMSGDILTQNVEDFPPNERGEINVVNNSEENQSPQITRTPRKSYVILAVLVFINLLNYMDRFTIAGVLEEIMNYYFKGQKLDRAATGLLQTSFIMSYMVLSPIFGYLGDRISRKAIMTVGIFFWSAITLASSFIPADSYGWFVFMRGMVGIGEASYSTIAPTILADLFTGKQRSAMLAIFYFAIPVGSGMGYIVGSNVAKAIGSWQWALRITPALGIICVFLILILVKEPKRGEAEGGTHLSNTSYFTDLKQLARNKSFMLSTIGFTSVAFVTGALALWGPYYVHQTIKERGEHTTEAQVSLIFGIITVLAGLIGVACGSTTAARWKVHNPRADPLVCAFGLLTCVPFLYLALVLSRYNTAATWVLIFLGETMLCLNWAIVADILLGVVIPTRRSTAEAFQILVSHAFGDAGSPYLIAAIADALSIGQRNTLSTQVWTFQYGLFITCFVAVLGGAAFLACAIFIEKDNKRVQRIIHGLSEAGDLENDLALPAPDIDVTIDVNQRRTLVDNEQNVIA
ncbi:unnamed protein product [Owenia fusiformis]|uniref:Uncharacterized protein n=1 Tax=Owenia fusiformis TaxID=6347 RepID=A0A8J1YAQ6_OWEFU|nr:unnamed protein product [Owenia fusiformis]